MLWPEAVAANIQHCYSTTYDRYKTSRNAGQGVVLMQYVLGNPIEKYALEYDNWDAEEAEQAEWDRKVKAGEIE